MSNEIATTTTTTTPAQPAPITATEWFDGLTLADQRRALDALRGWVQANGGGASRAQAGR